LIDKGDQFAIDASVDMIGNVVEFFVGAASFGKAFDRCGLVFESA
jgi:hypothetical protein